MALARRVWRTRQKNGPGLLFILVALVVVAAAGARYVGLYTPEQPTLAPQWRAAKTEEEPLIEEEVSRRTQEPVTVLVLHAHTSENYSPSPSHDKNGKGEILTVGAEFCQAISEKGIKAIHLKASFDVPKYSDAFKNAGEAVARALAENPGIKAVVDIHRDGLPVQKDKDYTAAVAAGQRVAKILFIVGDVANPNTSSNMAFAEAVKSRLDSMFPGVSRGIKVQHRSVNGHLHPNTLCAYIGDYNGNTLAEARASARLLADAVAAVLLQQAQEGMSVLPTTTP